MRFPAPHDLKDVPPEARWKTARGKLRSGVVLPEIKPSFALKADDEIFTMGSCFARNIEQHLAAIGCRIPTRTFVLPAHENIQNISGPGWGLTLFVPTAFRQIVEWTEVIMLRDGRVNAADCEPYRFVMPDGGILDLGLSTVTPVTEARFLERRQQLYDLYKRIFSSDCVVMTPGLIEAWIDRKTGKYIDITPIYKGEHLDKSRFDLDLLEFSQCFDSLNAVIQIVRRHNPKAKFLITVSPVPLHTTFTGKDILTANMHSKSVLRAACAELCEKNEQTDYFPSYEAAMLSRRWVWAKDRRHITDWFVSQMVDSLAEKYFPSEQFERTPASFGDRINQFLSMFRRRGRTSLPYRKVQLPR